MFTSQQEMDDFDEAVREILKAQKDKLSLSDDAVGKIAYGFLVGRRTKVQAIFVGQGADKYRKKQKLRLSDVMNLSQALGLSIHDVIRQAEKAMK